MDANAPENCDRITPYLYDEGVAATMDWIPGRSVWRERDVVPADMKGPDS